MELAKPLLVRAVPDVDEAIGAAGGERVVLAMEGDGVHLKVDGTVWNFQKQACIPGWRCV